MATITIKNVPNKVVEKIWTSIEYSDDFKFLWKKRIINNFKDSIEYWDDIELNNLWKSSLITSNSF